MRQKTVSTYHLRFLVVLVVLFALLSDSAQSAKGDLACSSYEAVYKPHPKHPEHDQYEMTISEVFSEVSSLHAYDILRVLKSDAKGNSEYEILLHYNCSGGSAPGCRISAETEGRSISIEPQALNRDFSRTFFIARGRGSRAHEMAPYALVFPGATSWFYYAGRYLTDEHLKWFTEDKPYVHKFPTVWLLDECKKK